MLIVDSSSLILLTKAGLIEPLVNKEVIVIPQSVFQETVEAGIQQGFTDALKIDRLIKEKKIAVKTLLKRKNFAVKLGKGEEEALQLYFQEKAEAIVLDDKKVIALCQNLKIQYKTAHKILFSLLETKAITKKEAIVALEKLTEEGRYSSDITLYYYKKINEEA